MNVSTVLLLQNAVDNLPKSGLVVSLNLENKTIYLWNLSPHYGGDF